MTRKALPTSKRAAIWRAHESRCIYCTELVAFADLDVDHIIPLHLKCNPDMWEKLLKEYDLGSGFDVDGLLNLVPSHRHCNLQKKGHVLSKNRAFHFLSIVEDKYQKACNIESEIKKQAMKDQFSVLLEIALEEGRISREQLSSLVLGYAENQNIFEVLSSFTFVDSELKGFLSSTDIDSLYERPILPRLHGLNKLNMVRTDLSGKETISVCSCREWVDAVKDGYMANSTYDIKEESYFKKVYGLVVALAQAKAPKQRFISDQKVSIANFDLLPICVLPALSGDGIDELKRFESEGVCILDLIFRDRLKIVSSSPLSLTLHFDDTGLYLYEILKADLNDDGIEDILIGCYEWALGGTFGFGYTIALTRLGKDQPFTVSENIRLDV